MAITSDFESEHRGSIPRIPATTEVKSLSSFVTLNPSIIAVSFWEGVGLQNQQAQFDSEHGCQVASYSSG